MRLEHPTIQKKLWNFAEVCYVLWRWKVFGQLVCEWPGAWNSINYYQTTECVAILVSAIHTGLLTTSV